MTHPAVGWGDAVWNADQLAVFRRDRTLAFAIYDPCTHILENAVIARRNNESEAERNERQQHLKARRALNAEALAAKGLKAPR